MSVVHGLHFSQALAKDFAKQVFQDNVAVCLIQCVAKDLACLLSIGSTTLRNIRTLSSLLQYHHVVLTRSNHQYRHVSFVQPAIRVSMSLQSLEQRTHTSHCSHLCGRGSIPMARQGACHAVKSFFAPYYMRSSLSNASWYLFHASSDSAKPRRHPSCSRKLAYEVAGRREGS